MCHSAVLKTPRVTFVSTSAVTCLCSLSQTSHQNHWIHVHASQFLFYLHLSEVYLQHSAERALIKATQCFPIATFNGRFFVFILLTLLQHLMKLSPWNTFCPCLPWHHTFNSCSFSISLLTASLATSQCWATPGPRTWACSFFCPPSLPKYWLIYSCGFLCQLYTEFTQTCISSLVFTSGLQTCLPNVYTWIPFEYLICVSNKQWPKKKKKWTLDFSSKIHFYPCLSGQIHKMFSTTKVHKFKTCIFYVVYCFRSYM